jgi:hypothetical protein
MLIRNLQGLLSLFKTLSAFKIADPPRFCYIALCLNQQDIRPDAWIFLSFCLSFLRTTTQVRFENLFLRKQLEIAERSPPKLKIKPTDRFFLGFLTDLYTSWSEALPVVRPETVIRWHRKSFRVFWKWISRSTPGRPAIPQTQITLIKQMAADNPLSRGSADSRRDAQARV